MNFKPFLNAIPYLATGLLFVTAVWGAVGILSTIASFVESWLSAKRKINTQVPALTAAVKELRDRQYCFERELERIKTRQAS